MAYEPELFDPKPEEQPDDKLPPDRWRNCGRCGQQFWSRVRRKRPTLIPLHCDGCDRIHGEQLTERTRRKRLTHYYDNRGDTWRPHGYVKPPRKQAKRALRSPAMSPGAGPAPEENAAKTADNLRGAVAALMETGKPRSTEHRK